jgi:tetratricopeptide (TPR) repeat protein
MTLPENYEDDSIDDGLQAPPRILFWGLIAAVLLVVVGILAGIFIFREVLTPGQQQRIIDAVPFARAFLPPQPAPDTILPTVAPVDPDSAMDLLNLDFSSPTDTPAPEITEATEAVLPNPPSIIVPSATPQPTEALPTPTPTIPPATPTIAPTETPAQSAQIATSTPNVVQAPAVTRATSHVNTGFTWDRQTWNNCGATNITMAMSYYGWGRSQAFAESMIKPDREDKNVTPAELVNFVNNNSDLRALYRIGGDMNLLRTLIYYQFPVVIERSHMFEGYDWLGHYQTLVGYDDTQSQFTIYDSFLGENELDTYTEVDTHWQAFNRVFIVVYQPEREAELFRLLGELADQERAAEIAFETAQAEARANPQNAFAWFNMGSALVELNRYQEASTAYDQAMNLGLPWRMLWYQFGPYRAYYEVGRYQDVLNYVANSLSTDGGQYVEETYYWQGRALVQLGRNNEAINSFQRALNQNRFFADARQAITALGG